MQTDGCVPEAHELRQRRRSRAAAVDRLLEELLPEILQACRAMSRRAELEHAAREQANLMTRTLGEQNRAMIEDLLQTCAAAREASAAARLSIQDLASKVDGIDRRLSDAPPVEPASESKYQSAADRQRHSSVQNNDAASEEIGALDMLRELDRRLPPLPVHTASVRSHRPSIRQEIKRRSWFGRQPA
ncbi:hypothetical protein H4R19_004439 [Coemansia spiralis]|nr:hypothetical protein H4R19_004439 [Coemansia spiralis]